jgi:hypothetical protein
MAYDLTTKAEELRSKSASHSGFDDYDPNDWGRTESEDALHATLESAGADELCSEDLVSADLESVDLDDPDLDDPDLDDEVWGRTASDEALMAELRSEPDEKTPPHALRCDSELAWPESLTPDITSKATPKPAQPAPAKAPAARTAEGALRQALSQNSRDTTLMKLAKKGVKNVKVLGMATIEKIVEKAVATAIENSAVGYSIEESKRIEEDARRQFFKLLRKHKQVLAEKTTSQQQHSQLAGQVKELSRELAEAEAALAHKRRDSGMALSKQTLGDLETTFQGLLAGFMTDERRGLLQADDPNALKGFVELEQKLGTAFDRLLDRVKSQAEDLLERRIGKLNAALEETETALRHLALSKGFDDGVASVYDSIQGLNSGEVDFGRKKDLLAIVFVENLEIQHLEVADEHRRIYADAFVALENSRAQQPSPAPIAPAGFSTPVETTIADVAF